MVLLCLAAGFVLLFKPWELTEQLCPALSLLHTSGAALLHAGLLQQGLDVDFSAPSVCKLLPEMLAKNFSLFGITEPSKQFLTHGSVLPGPAALAEGPDASSASEKRLEPSVEVQKVLPLTANNSDAQIKTFWMR